MILLYFISIYQAVLLMVILSYIDNCQYPLSFSDASTNKCIVYGGTVYTTSTIKQFCVFILKTIYDTSESIYNRLKIHSIL